MGIGQQVGNPGMSREAYLGQVASGALRDPGMAALEGVSGFGMIEIRGIEGQKARFGALVLGVTDGARLPFVPVIAAFGLDAVRDLLMTGQAFIGRGSELLRMAGCATPGTGSRGMRGAQGTGRLGDIDLLAPRPAGIRRRQKKRDEREGQEESRGPSPITLS